VNEHERSLTLAAAALDFPLSTRESADLQRHLASCAACALTARRLRDDALGLAASERLPAPPEVRVALVRAVTGERGGARRPTNMRWSLAAALLALIVMGGTFVTGAVLDRLRDTGPVPTHDLVPRPTRSAVPTRPEGWTDLGVVGDAFEGRIVRLVLPGPGGGLVAIGRDQRSTAPMVWTSADGSTWVSTTQPEDAFGGRVPTGGASRDGTLWVVGWDISVGAPQRAVWSSPDGVTWRRVPGDGGLLGTEASGLDMAAGPAGLLVWAPDGRAWTSSDGRAWVRSDAGVTGVSDAVVDDGFRMVGFDGERAFLVSSADGRTWAAPSGQAAVTGDRVGIERPDAGATLAWVGERAYALSRTGWRPASGAPDVPSGEVVGGRPGFVAVAAPAVDGTQRAWVGDGSDAWASRRSDAPVEGAHTIVDIAPLDDGWYVLTRAGGTYRGWRLS